MYLVDNKKGYYMKRCDVCDSTEMRDELALGGADPIEGWYWIKKYQSWRCDRCHHSVVETYKEYERDENNPMVGGS